MILVFECGLAVALVCRLFGHCRQAFYQSKADIEKEVEHERKVIEAVREIRVEDPGIGGYKLWLMLIAMFGRGFVPGRDLSGSESLKGLIHHSDRGVQYCCDAYVAMLNAHDISISMCEDYKPTDNAIAERTNGIIKVECLYRQEQLHTYEHMQNIITHFIHFYNYHRLHMSIGYKTPVVAHLEQGVQERKWKNKIYPKKDSTAFSLVSIDSVRQQQNRLQNQLMKRKSV